MRRLVLAIALFICGTAATPARAALDFQPCAQPAGVQCAQIQVPVDRSGNVGGTFTLLVHRVPARGQATRPPLVFLAGGPGQTNTALTPFALERYRGALATRDLIAFSQRGTGASEVHCAALERGDDPATAVPACAQQLGPARNFYTTRDAADDLDAVRQALGVEKVALAGGSYATWVEQAYAIRHPTHVDRLVLDSTVGPNQNADPFGREQFAEAPTVARRLCHLGACKGITKDPWADLIKLFARLDKKPLSARVVQPNGKIRKVTLGALAVASPLPNIDVDPPLRAELPRAIAGALKGDPASLARIVFGGPSGPPVDPRGAVNQTVFNLTRCEEDVQPFDRTAAPADRLTQAHQNLAAIPAADFAPFGPDIVFLLSAVPTCAYWPMLPQQPSFGSGPPANVPVLLLSGEFDLRSTKSSTDTVASEFPQAKVLSIPNTGHTATRSELTRCARSAAARFLGGGAVPARCKRTRDPFAPLPLVPGSLAKVKPVGIGLKGRAGRAVVAAKLTVADAFMQLDKGSHGRASVETKVKGGGLRGGTFHGSKKGLVLKRYVLVKGFPVTGLVRPRGAFTLKIPHGTLRFAGGKVTGKLPGTKFSATTTIQRRSIASHFPVTR